MYAESNVTSSMVHMIHTDSSTIVLPDMAEFTCCTHALIVESKRLASCGTVAIASMSGKIVFLTLVYTGCHVTFRIHSTLAYSEFDTLFLLLYTLVYAKYLGLGRRYEAGVCTIVISMNGAFQ